MGTHMIQQTAAQTARPLQPTLFEPLPALIRPTLVKGASLQESFEAFHRANPAVYAALKRMALDMRRKGVRRYGIGGLFELMRWQYALQTQGDEYRLNNNYRSRYARLLMDDVGELRNFFEVRELQSE
jgi:hypothetical protein